jgi:hypothetical protein
LRIIGPVDVVGELPISRHNGRFVPNVLNKKSGGGIRENFIAVSGARDPRLLGAGVS